MGGMSTSDVKRMRSLEDENRKLKRLVADLSLDNVALKDIVSGKI
jgi:putative transposase